MAPPVIASFVVDRDPIFAYTGWGLAHSLANRGNIRWSEIHVQFTPEVDAHIIEMFRKLGCTTHALNRFGDGKFCNKLAQWESLRDVDADQIVFFDTDMICLSDFRPFISRSSIGGKVVDLDNPAIDVLDALFERVGFKDRPDLVQVDATNAETYRGNCNGGFYSVPKEFAEPLFNSWRGYAELLLADLEPLQRLGKEAHVDQISFCMAIHSTGLPFVHLPSNVNYYLHMPGRHQCKDHKRPLSVLHFHNSTLNVVGLLEPSRALEEDEQAAVADANAQIQASFNTQLFWDMRYQCFPERGSGIGSRGSNLTYKRELLKREGVEQANSILDVGCGDLEVLWPLDLRNYTGVDRSEASLAVAAAARPEWSFCQAPAINVDPADIVLCFEVAIHQETAKDYDDLIRFVTEKTLRTLIISGYDELNPQIACNHMLFFYEPLKKSLVDTGKFRTVRQIGQHTDVIVYRCDVQ